VTRGRGLARACPGKPRGAAARARLTSLRAGRHPVTGEYLAADGLRLPGFGPAAEAEAVTRGVERWSALLALVRAREMAADA